MLQNSCPNNKDAVHVGIDGSMSKYEAITRWGCIILYYTLSLNTGVKSVGLQTSKWREKGLKLHVCHVT